MPCVSSQDLGGCPKPPSDGGAAPCTYLVNFGQLEPGSTYPVVVSEPGFDSVLVNDVVTGWEACGVTYDEPSVITVTLSPR